MRAKQEAAAAKKAAEAAGQAGKKWWWFYTLLSCSCAWYTRLLCVCALFDGIKSSLCCNSNGIFLCMNIKLFTSQAARLSRKKAWKGQKRFRIDCIKSPGFVCSLFRSIWYRIKNVLPSCLCMSLVSKELSYLKGESGDERERELKCAVCG